MWKRYSLLDIDFAQITADRLVTLKNISQFSICISEYCFFCEFLACLVRQYINHANWNTRASTGTSSKASTGKQKSDFLPFKQIAFSKCIFLFQKFIQIKPICLNNYYVSARIPNMCGPCTIPTKWQNICTLQA